MINEQAPEKPKHQEAPNKVDITVPALSQSLLKEKQEIKGGDESTSSDGNDQEFTILQDESTELQNHSKLKLVAEKYFI